MLDAADTVNGPVSMARDLEAEFGKGFNYSSLTRMVRFVEAFPDEANVATLSQHLSCIPCSGYSSGQRAISP